MNSLTRESSKWSNKPKLSFTAINHIIDLLIEAKYKHHDISFLLNMLSHNVWQYPPANATSSNHAIFIFLIIYKDTLITTRPRRGLGQLVLSHRLI